MNLCSMLKLRQHGGLPILPVLLLASTLFTNHQGFGEDAGAPERFDEQASVTPSLDSETYNNWVRYLGLPETYFRSEMTQEEWLSLRDKVMRGDLSAKRRLIHHYASIGESKKARLWTRYSLVDDPACANELSTQAYRLPVNDWRRLFGGLIDSSQRGTSGPPTEGVAPSEGGCCQALLDAAAGCIDAARVLRDHAIQEQNFGDAILWTRYIAFLGGAVERDMIDQSKNRLTDEEWRYVFDVKHERDIAALWEKVRSTTGASRFLNDDEMADAMNAAKNGDLLAVSKLRSYYRTIEENLKMDGSF